jgi:hypothetical protein
MPDLKEPWYFVPEMRSRFYRPSFRRPETLEDYCALFSAAEPEQRVGEASPSYLMSLEAAGRIAQAQPAARIIAILREPASFLRSLHLQYVQTQIEDETDLRTALSLEEARRRGERIPRHSGRPQGLQYSELVHYVDQLERYYAVFPREQVLVLIYDDFRSDNEGTVRRVLRFLGVQDTMPIELTEANPSVRVRSMRLHELLQAVSVGHGPMSRAVKASVKALSTRGARRTALKMVRRKVLFGRPHPPDDELMLELRRRYKPEVVALSEYLDRDLVSLWGYGNLD